MRKAKQVVTSIIDEAKIEADDDGRKAATKHWLVSQNANRLRAMIDLATTEPGIPVTIDQLDADPFLLNVANGTLDLRTGSLRPHQRSDLITRLSPTRYNEHATSTTWTTFLRDVFDGDDELIRFMQVSAGIALTGDVTAQYLWFLYGLGANGKSTFLNAVRYVLGDLAIQLDARLLMTTHNDQHPTGLTDLRGVRLATTVEVEQGRQLAESLVKQLTGGDPIRARRMRADFFEFTPSHKIWLASNHLPAIAGTDHAIWRRILLVPFEVTFTDQQQDPDLGKKLEAEGPGILAWMVQGGLDWQANGLTIPDRVKTATDGYRAQEDHIGRFLADCTTTGGAVATSHLREAYNAWCVDAGETPWNSTMFGRELTSRGYPVEKLGGRKYRQGIVLTADSSVVI
jgi:putative DNA primase/helicase